MSQMPQNQMIAGRCSTDFLLSSQGITSIIIALSAPWSSVVVRKEAAQENVGGALGVLRH